MAALTATRRPAGEAGVSLLELLVALLIVAFVVLGVLTSLGQGVRFNSSSRDYAAVSNLAKSQLEDLIARGFRDPALAPGGPFTRLSPDDRYRVSYSVREVLLTAREVDPDRVVRGVEAPGVGNLKVITVTVSPRRSEAPGQRELTVEAVKHLR